MRAVKEVRFKIIGGSLAIYRSGAYWASIPLKKFYQLIENSGSVGKGAVLVKDSIEGNQTEKGVDGKVLIDDDKESFL